VIEFVLLLIGFICFCLAAAGWGPSRPNLVATGLACWILVALIGAWPS
jgi:hypothetical protein